MDALQKQKENTVDSLNFQGYRLLRKFYRNILMNIF